MTIPAPPAGVTLNIECITPELATEMLYVNTHNRHEKIDAIRVYTEDMKAGNWHFNGASICFSKSGQLLDGQNRLRACVAAGVPFYAVVVRGLVDQSQSTMDSGVKRTFADMLKLEGFANAKNLAAGTLLLSRYLRTMNTGVKDITSHKKTSNHALHAVLDAHPCLSVSASFGTRKIQGLSASSICFLHYLCSLASINLEQPEAAAVFFKSLQTGASLEEDNPILVLRHWLDANAVKKPGKTPVEQEVILAITIKAWNFWLKGERIKKLMWSPGGVRQESFPIVHGFDATAPVPNCLPNDTEQWWTSKDSA